MLLAQTAEEERSMADNASIPAALINQMQATIRRLANLFHDVSAILAASEISMRSGAPSIIDEMETVRSRLEALQMPPMPLKHAGTSFQGLNISRPSDEQLAALGLTPQVLRELARDTELPLSPGGKLIMKEAEAACLPEMQIKCIREALGKLQIVPAELKKARLI
jgi:hypothetical protein